MKRSVLLLSDKFAARNPMIDMYIRSLGSKYHIGLICQDPGAASKAYPDIDDILKVESPPLAKLFLHIVRKMRGMRSGNRQLNSQATNRYTTESRYIKADSSQHSGLDYIFLLRQIVYSLSYIIRALRFRKPDVIIAIDGDMLAAARVLSAIWRIPYLYAVYEIWPNQFPWVPGKRVRALAMIEKWGLQAASKAIVVDDAFAKLLARRYRIPRSKFVKVCVCPKIPARSASLDIRSPLRIYYHGAYLAGRGLEHLVLSMAEVSGAHLYMRGFGSLEPTLRGLVVQHQLAEKVTFLEPVAMDYLSEAATDFDIGVIIACPTTANGRFVIGFKLFENMAAGLAIVCPRSHVLGPFLRAHAIGITFKGCQGQALANAIQYCVSHPDDVVSWKRAARVLAEQEYNAGVQEERLRQIIAESVARK